MLDCLFRKKLANSRVVFRLNGWSPHPWPIQGLIQNRVAKNQSIYLRSQVRIYKEPLEYSVSITVNPF